ncbi:hypothetical protein LTR15_008112 [Elasticomyces elasticus]|nr:hypothetical protein LTR15_008112 [Elasticomyces elasticus]
MAITMLFTQSSWVSQASKPLLRPREHDLQNVFLAQPPSMIGLTALTFFRKSDGRGKTFKLEAGETFGSLYAKYKASWDLEGLRTLPDTRVGLRWA